MRESQSISVCGDRCSVSPRSSRRNTAFSTLARCTVASDFNPHRLFSALRVYLSPLHFLRVFLCLRVSLGGSLRLLRRLNSSVIQVNQLPLSHDWWRLQSRPRAIDTYQMPCSITFTHPVAAGVACYDACPLSPISGVACAALPYTACAHHLPMRPILLNFLEF